MRAPTSQKRTAKTLDGTLRQLSGAIGDFIRYWGFRRIHGQIWTQLFLSIRPLSGAELARRLKVSKALISPALGELESYGLIFHADGDAKTKLYAANPEVFKVIREILKVREAQLIQKASDFYSDLSQLPSEAQSHGEIDQERMRRLGNMIASASDTLNLVMDLSQDVEREPV